MLPAAPHGEPPTKVLVIGLDSADPTLLLRWCDSGELPVLQSLRERGAWGALASPPAMGDEASWATFWTGLTPDHHGRFFYRQLVPGSYAFRRAVAEEAQAPPFWEAISRSGRRVAVVDVPKSPISSDLNGVQLADWRTHGREGDTRSTPPELAAEVVERFGDDPMDSYGKPGYMCLGDQLPRASYPMYLSGLLYSIGQKGAYCRELLARGGWDMFLTVFKESHCVAHQCWHLSDPAHPDYDAGLAGELGGNPVKQVYRALDHEVGRLLEMVGPEIPVIVFSDLGMEANATGEHLLDAVLLRREGSMSASLLKRASQWGQRFTHRRVRKLARRALQRSRGLRTAFQVPHNEVAGAIRVNVVGRERNGRIQPGAEFERFCSELTLDLLRLVDPESGRRLVDEVIRTDAPTDGSPTSMPDLLVVWNREAPITAVASPKLGRIRVPTRNWRSGNHVSDGIFFCIGPAVQPGELPAASLTDLAPTAAALLGVELEGVDGKALGALQREALTVGDAAGPSPTWARASHGSER
jgi:predicted AlkP superfamily phosphohydrolase/phosphomutase